MMQQYRRMKSQVPDDALLLFRLGDFYEMFFDDAKTGSELMKLTLTHRNGVPMCGIPHHAAESYLGRLLKHGCKVAICDQVEPAQPGKLVEREVTQILSPGTHFDARILDEQRHNFLAAVTTQPRQETQAPGRTAGPIGLALVDLTTGEFLVTELDTAEQLGNELARVQPSEVIVPEEQQGALQSILPPANVPGIAPALSPHDGWTFEPETAFFTLRDHFKTQTLDGFGAADLTVGIGAAGGVLHYLQQSLRRDTGHIHRLKVYHVRDYMIVDAHTQRNLELLEAASGNRRDSVLGCLDRTRTPMGARLLRDWITHPLTSVADITRRQEVIGMFIDQPQMLAAFRDALQAVRDMERTLGRLCVGSGNARDLVGLKESLAALPQLKQTIGTATDPALLRELHDRLTPLPDLVDLVERALVADPPLALKDGGLIREGYHDRLDELRRASSEGKEWIAALQRKEAERTGISSLKVRYNQVFGYYIEVTRANLNKVPAEYIRKQTIANGERFITPELKEMEGTILGADEKAHALEYELFTAVRDAAVDESITIQQSAAAVAAVDVLAGLAELARHQDYCRPAVNDGDRIEIHDGRHPVLEQTLIEDRFVPNDAALDGVANQILIITGPNMAGKSTYIRQVALLVLLAQTGSFIPAREATIGICDRIFTRIGATDDLARGQSTFMVEMTETANILNNATERSLVILDEIGRGTSTFDGLSIAWAVAEYLHEHSGARTLFATHYHELTELAMTCPRVKNFNVAVREWQDEVIFLHKILPGSTDKSYGIQVARLAGLPREVISRAREVLGNLEEAELSAEGQPKLARHKRRGKGKPASDQPTPQLTLFTPAAE